MKELWWSFTNSCCHTLWQSPKVVVVDSFQTATRECCKYTNFAYAACDTHVPTILHVRQQTHLLLDCAAIACETLCLCVCVLSTNELFFSTWESLSSILRDLTIIDMYDIIKKLELKEDTFMFLSRFIVYLVLFTMSRAYMHERT